MRNSSSHTDGNHRHRWTRLTAAGAILAAMSLAGCSAPDGPPRKPLLPFTKDPHDESIRQQAHSDSFPTAKQAGLQPSASRETASDE
jgi:hypothetical protein